MTEDTTTAAPVVEPVETPETDAPVGEPVETRQTPFR